MISGGAAPEVPPAAVLEVVRPGACATVQDRGRFGRGRFGVSPSGPMDPWAHRVANALAGNPPAAPALELTGPGVELLFLAPAIFAMAGADLGATLDGRALPATVLAWAEAGGRLQLAARRNGARVSLALAGGFTATPVLGSVATDLGAGLGGLDGRGRPLRAGQRLALAGPARPPRPPPLAVIDQRLAPLRAWLQSRLPGPQAPVALRYLPEELAGTSPEARAAFQDGRWRVSPHSGRTGYRLIGGALPVSPDPERLSEPTAPQALQLPPDGQPILLMADRNTTGGYPRLGHLAAVDRSRAGQLWPGDEITFVPVAPAEALSALRAAEDELDGLLDRLAAAR